MTTKNVFWISVIWVAILIASFSWNYYMTVSETVKLVENKAQSFFSQILVTRAWNSSHNGVYVPVDETTQPNMYLEDSLRDVVTEGGMKLTKINPAYMTRQISEINKSENDLQFHITSLNPLRPANKADAWETKALKSFEAGNKEILELIKDENIPHYRYMAPLVVEESCLNCHAGQGYKLGQIRGGISISFPSEVYTSSQNRQVFYILLAHILLIILGISGIILYYRMTNKFYKIIRQKNQELEADGILLRKANNELSISLAKNKATVAAMPDVLFTIDKQGKLLNYQFSIENSIFQEGEKLIGKTLSDILPNEIANQSLDAINEALDSKELQVFEYTIPFLESQKWFELRIVSSSNDEVLAISRDITDRKHGELEIRSKNDELSKLNAEKDKFFSIIAHDLRSPFNSFLGFTEMMAENLSSMSQDDIQRIAISMKNSANKLFQLLENLLEWAKMQQGISPFKPEKISLSSLVNESLAMIMETAKSKNIEISNDISLEKDVFVDSNMIQTVIRNLFTNALKFTPKGGKIVVKAKETEDNTIELSINDSGIGMNPELRAKLFRIDEQTSRKGTDGEPSSGLGLLICKDFVEKNGGEIWVESEDGKGSTFYFTMITKENQLL